jgi:L-asparaginase II
MIIEADLADTESARSIGPVLIEVTRGGRVESRHRGAIAVVDAGDGLALAIGDVETAVYPRSAVKALQALPLIETGAADRLGLSDVELALACSSHSGEPTHVAAVLAMLATAGRDPSSLLCGTHWPYDEGAARALAAAGERPGSQHNNCSGKHAGFICTACALGEDPRGYIAPDHPTMRRVTSALGEVCGVALDQQTPATDGCSIPTYAISLRALASGFARFGSGSGLPAARAAAASRLRAAVAAQPFMVAGTGRIDTQLMEALGPRVFVKGGAEGVHCGALPELGLGFALKCEDGASRAADAATAALIARLLPLVGAAAATVYKLAKPTLRNWSGTVVGGLRPVGPLAAALPT